MEINSTNLKWKYEDFDAEMQKVWESYPAQKERMFLFSEAEVLTLYFEYPEKVHTLKKWLQAPLKNRCAL